MKLSFPRQWHRLVLGLVIAIGWAPPAWAAYEAEMAAFAAQDLANPPPANVIVFTGSSSIVGWSGLTEAFPGYPVLNRGFGGSQMNDVLDKFDNVITPYRAPLIVLYEGDNDIWAGEAPSAIFAEYVTFVNRVDTEFPGTDIIIIAVKPSPSRVSRLAATAELNGLLRDLCTTRPNLRYADVFTPMLNATGQPRPELFGSDMLHMNSAGYALWQQVVAPLLAEAPFSTEHSWLFDFGPSSQVPGSGWNNVSTELGATPGGLLNGVVNASGQAATLTLEIMAPFNAANLDGSQSSAVFPAAATRDSLYGNTSEFNGNSNVFPGIRLNGLDPALAYRFTFFSSRTGVTDNRETRYTVAGAATTSTLLNAAENVNGVAIVSGVVPDAQQGITISLAPGPANTSPNQFTYLGVLKVDGLPPAPVDAAAPLLLSGTGRSSTALELTFNEPLDPASITNPASYLINQGAFTVTSATLLSGGRVISLKLDAVASGSVTVAVNGIRDTSGNAVAAGSQVVIAIPVSGAEVLFFDFGASSPAMEAADDPVNAWNNITPAVGSSDTGVLPTLVTASNQATTAGFQMIRRFNGANTNGTTASTVFPADATSDSLFGNTELFSSLTNIFPSFKLTGLAPGQGYDFTFFASRTGVSDNRETRYTVVGTNTVIAHLQVAGNINGVVEARAVRPTAAGEITISLAPGANNNNANHFTYLGAMKITPAPPLDLLPPQLVNGRIQLQWTGSGQLEHADTPGGPWTAILPAPQSPFSEDINPLKRRFYRLRTPAP